MSGYGRLRPEAVRVAARAAERLGRIEKFLLVYVLRQRDAKNDFHARSCALQAYHKDMHGVSTRHKRNVRRIMPAREYRSLQVRFTNAINRLEGKGYIDVYRGRLEGRQLLETVQGMVGRRAGETDFVDMGNKAYVRVDGQLALICDVSSWMRYRVVYRLTERGWSKAREIRESTVT